jgi:hypothetical protein
MHVNRIRNRIFSGYVVLVLSLGAEDAAGQAHQSKREMPWSGVVSFASVEPPEGVVTALGDTYCFLRPTQADSAAVLAAIARHDPAGVARARVIFDHARRNRCPSPRARISVVGRMHQNSDLNADGYGGEVGGSFPSGWGLYAGLQRTGYDYEAEGETDYIGVQVHETYSLRVRKWSHSTVWNNSFYTEFGPTFEYFDFTELNHEERLGIGGEVGWVWLFAGPLGLQGSVGGDILKVIQRERSGESQPLSDALLVRAYFSLGAVFQMTL